MKELRHRDGCRRSGNGNSESKAKGWSVVSMKDDWKKNPSMSQLNKSHHQARKPAGDETKRVRWVVAGGLVWSGVLAFAVLGLPSAHPTATASADVADNAASTSADFAPTTPNRTPAPGPAPEGMVWIPGGEFSMGSDAAGESMCGLPGVTRDALPIHRVYVDGFWMDATEVTNEQFEKFVEGHRLRHRRRAEADAGRISHRAAGESRRRLDRLHADAAAGAAEQSLPMVELRARRELAASRPGRAATSKAARNFPWCRSPTKTPRPTRSGRASGCPPRRNGSSPRAAAWRASCMRGATS